MGNRSHPLHAARMCAIKNHQTIRVELEYFRSGGQDASITNVVAEIIDRRPITEVWGELGGDPPRRGRARAFYREGDNLFAVSLNDAKGCWFDHRDGVGGGLLDLILHVRGGNRRSALRWLAELNGIPLDDHPLTESERREYARQRAEGLELAAWKERLVDALKRERERWWRIYHGALRYILDSGLDAPLGAIAADLYELAEDRVDVLNWQMDTLKTATNSDLLPAFQEQKRRPQNELR